MKFSKRIVFKILLFIQIILLIISAIIPLVTTGWDTLLVVYTLAPVAMITPVLLVLGILVLRTERKGVSIIHLGVALNSLALLIPIVFFTPLKDLWLRIIDLFG